MRVLLVKTSSLGDVVHNLPLVTDLCRLHPGARIDWLVEEAFAEIPSLHPRVENVIPVAFRRWRRRLAHPATWREIAALKARLSRTAYDWVLDTQGLLKSAWAASWARGAHVGFGPCCVRERLALPFYDRTVEVDASAHAVVRYRSALAKLFGTEPGPLDYGLLPPPEAPSFAPEPPYGVLLVNASRADKLLPESFHAAVIAALKAGGLVTVLPWGRAEEYARVEGLARAQPETAIVAPRMGLAEAAALLAHARVVVGVDTGLTHLAAALGVPTVALFVATDPARVGLYATTPCIDLGGPGRPPSVADAIAAVERLVDVAPAL